MGLGANLQDVLLSKRYRSQLLAGYRELSDWAVVQSRVGPYELRDDSKTMNTLLVDFAQSCYDRHLSLSRARRAILGVQHVHRHLAGNLRNSWDSISSWQQLAPVRMRIPCPETIAHAIFVTSLLNGFWLEPERSHLWIPFGILCWVSFVGLLRPGEAVGLRGRDVVLPSFLHTALVDAAIVSIDNPKNRRYLGRRQVSKIDNKLATDWLRWLTDSMHPDLKLFPGSLATFRSLFRSACCALEIADLKLSPASLRAGGATHLFVGGMETSRLRILGRWKGLESLDHYVQIAASALTLIQTSPEVLEVLSQVRDHSDVFKLPPDAPWSVFFSRTAQLRRHARWTSRDLPLPLRRLRPSNRQKVNSKA